MNKPYIKQYEEIDITDSNPIMQLTNPITKDSPYLHNSQSLRGKSKKRYIPIHNHMTGEFIAKYKQFGNNRANTSKRKDKNSRTYYIN